MSRFDYVECPKNSGATREKFRNLKCPSLELAWLKGDKRFWGMSVIILNIFLSGMQSKPPAASLSPLSHKYIQNSVFYYNFLACVWTCTTHIPVLSNKNTPGPNKENVTVFVLGSWQGSQVTLSEVKVTEAALPSDSFCRGGHGGEQWGGRSGWRKHTLNRKSRGFHVVVREQQASRGLCTATKSLCHLS